MNGAYQNNAKADPQKTGKPPKRLASQYWTGDGTGCCYRREVLSKKIEWFGGNEINVVIDDMSRRYPTVIQYELPGEPPPIDSVGSDEESNKANCEKRQAQFALFSAVVFG